MLDLREQYQRVDAVVAELMKKALAVKSAAYNEEFHSPAQMALFELANSVTREVDKLWAVSGALRTEANKIDAA